MLRWLRWWPCVIGDGAPCTRRREGSWVERFVSLSVRPGSSAAGTIHDTSAAPVGSIACPVLGQGYSLHAAKPVKLFASSTSRFSAGWNSGRCALPDTHTTARAHLPAPNSRACHSSARRQNHANKHTAPMVTQNKHALPLTLKLAHSSTLLRRSTHHERALARPKTGRHSHTTRENMSAPSRRQDLTPSSSMSNTSICFAEKKVDGPTGGPRSGGTTARLWPPTFMPLTATSNPARGSSGHALLHTPQAPKQPSTARHCSWQAPPLEGACASPARARGPCRVWAHRVCAPGIMPPMPSCVCASRPWR